MLNVVQSAQGLNSSAHTQNSPPNSRIFYKDLYLTKKDWGEVKRLLKGYSNGQKPAIHERRVVVPFIEI
jgi:hypothetical protein